VLLLLLLLLLLRLHRSWSPLGLLPVDPRWLSPAYPLKLED
jgi:hypothetical protein